MQFAISWAPPLKSVHELGVSIRLNVEEGRTLCKTSLSEARLVLAANRMRLPLKQSRIKRDHMDLSKVSHQLTTSVGSGLFGILTRPALG